MSNVKVIQVEDNQRQRIVPREAMHQPVRHGTDHAAHDKNHPDPAQYSHVAVLVALVRLGVSRCSPHELDVEEPVLDGGQIGVGLDQHDVLHSHAVLGLGPAAEHDEAVEDGRDGEGKVVVLEPLGTEPEEQDTRDGRDENTDGNGRVVEEACSLY